MSLEDCWNSILVLIHQLIVLFLQFNLNFRSHASLLNDVKFLFKHLLNGLKLHQFLSNLFGEEFRVDLGLIWIFGVLYSEELLLMLVNELQHKILSLNSTKVANFELVNLLDEL